MKGSQAKVPCRKFVVELFVEVEVEQAVFDAVLTDEWRAQIAPFFTPEQVAEHLAFNLVQGTPLTSIDGYADQDPKSVKIGYLDISHSYEIGISRHQSLSRESKPKHKPRSHPKEQADGRRSKKKR